jgi:hypothetical protein
VPDEDAGTDPQAVTERTANGKHADKHRDAKQTELQNLMVAGEPVAHGGEDGRSCI